MKAFTLEWFHTHKPIHKRVIRMRHPPRRYEVWFCEGCPKVFGRLLDSPSLIDGKYPPIIERLGNLE